MNSAALSPITYLLNQLNNLINVPYIQSYDNFFDLFCVIEDYIATVQTMQTKIENSIKAFEVKLYFFINYRNEIYYKLYDLPDSDFSKRMFIELDDINHNIHSPEIDYETLTEEIQKFQKVHKQINKFIEERKYKEKKSKILLFSTLFTLFIILLSGIYHYRLKALYYFKYIIIIISSFLHKYLHYSLRKKKLTPYYTLYKINNTHEYYLSLRDMYQYTKTISLIDTKNQFYSIYLTANLTVYEFKKLISPIYKMPYTSLKIYKDNMDLLDYDWLETTEITNPLIVTKKYVLSIIYSNGSIYSLSISSHYYIKQMKYKIKSILNIPVNKQKLYLNKILLNDNHTLDYYDIRNYDSLYLYYYYPIYFQVKKRIVKTDIETNQLIDVINNIISKNYNISYTNQQLIFKNQVLFPYQTFSYYNIAPEDTIYYHTIMTLIIHFNTINTITVSPSITIYELKQLLSKIYYTDIQEMIVFYGKELLLDKKKIKYYGIQDNSIINLRLIQ